MGIRLPNTQPGALGDLELKLLEDLSPRPWWEQEGPGPVSTHPESRGDAFDPLDHPNHTWERWVT